MCGIAGIANFDGTAVERGVLERMSNALRHRGPDGMSVWVNGSVGFGHRRLAIRDLTEAGSQPMHYNCGSIVVTYNGEIYNDSSLRRSISASAPVEFRSSCDTEVIAPAYSAWGTDAFSRFEGMFAIGLWDARTRRLVLARDPSGIKPLYYLWNGRSLRFASEIKGLLAAPDCPRRICPQGLHRYLAQGYPGPERTLLQDVYPVPPGSFVVASAEGIRIERYWKPKRTGEIRDLDAALEAFQSLWKEVVSDMLVSDVPVGLLLSSGVDSALVASALPGRGIPAFTARFSSRDYDEAGNAAKISARFGLQHFPIEVDTVGEIEQRFLKVVHHYDGNCADSSGLAFHAVCEAARQHVPVLLTGDGADEFFGGYETFRASRIAHAIAPVLPRRFAGMAADRLFSLGRSGDKKVPASEKIARFLSGIAYGKGLQHPQWRRHVYPKTMERTYGPMLRELAFSVDPLDEYAEAINSESGSLVDRCLLGDQTYYLPGDLLMKSDTMSMAHGVEVRVPFLDRRVMEFAGKLHVSLLTPFRGPDKRILRSALEKTGIDQTIVKGKKKGFNVPVAYHLRNGLRKLGERLLVSNADVLAPYFYPDALAGFWRDHSEGKANHGYALWTLLTHAVWRESAGIQ